MLFVAQKSARYKHTKKAATAPAAATLV